MRSEVSFFQSWYPKIKSALICENFLAGEERSVHAPCEDVPAQWPQKGSWPNAETEIRKKGNGEAGLSPRKMLWPWIYAVHMDINIKPYLYRAQL